MSRTFRGVWSRRGTLVPLALLTVVLRVLYLEPSEDLSIWDRREPVSPPDLPESSG